MTDPDPSALVEARNLSFGYDQRRILDDVTFTVPRGKVTALMGASGGGKTTVLRLIGGQVRPQSGELLFDGESIPGLATSAVEYGRAHLGRVRALARRPG